MSNIQSKIKGCLLAGAAGDALGAPIEFKKLEDIKKIYGPRGITAYHGIGLITDDTQMTLYTAEAMIRAHRANDGAPEKHLDNAYKRWIMGQSPYPPSLTNPGVCYSNAMLNDRRAPGHTCLQELRTKINEEPNAPLYPANQSKGCGSIMRVAPIGLYQAVRHGLANVDFTWDLAIKSAALTHGHITGQLATAYFAHLIQMLVWGVALDSAIEQATKVLITHPGHEETLQSVELAQSLARDARHPEIAIPLMGDGHISESCLAIALYACLKFDDLDEVLIAAVNHNGDADSTANSAGQIWGAIHGESAISSKWLDTLECRDFIAQIGSDIAACDQDDPGISRWLQDYSKKFSHPIRY